MNILDGIYTVTVPVIDVREQFLVETKRAIIMVASTMAHNEFVGNMDTPHTRAMIENRTKEILLTAYHCGDIPWNLT